MEKIINFLKKKVREAWGEISAVPEKVAQLQPVRNVKENIRLISSPETRETWFRGFTPNLTLTTQPKIVSPVPYNPPTQTIRPLERIKANLQALLSPKTRGTYLTGLFSPITSLPSQEPVRRLTTNIRLLTQPQTRENVLQGMGETLEEKMKQTYGEGLAPAVATAAVKPLVKGFTRGATAPFTKEPLIKKVSDIAAGIGSTALAGESVVLGAINPLFTTIATLATQRRLPTKDELLKSYEEGVRFGTEFGPIARATAPILNPIVAKFGPKNVKTALDLAKRMALAGLKGGAEFGAYGKLKGESALDNALQGALFSAVTEGAISTPEYLKYRSKEGKKLLYNIYNELHKSYQEANQRLAKGELPIGLTTREITPEERIRLRTGKKTTPPLSSTEELASRGEVEKPIGEPQIPISPKNIPQGMKERKFYQTVMESKGTPEFVKEELPKSKVRFYTPVSLPERMTKAAQYIQEIGFEKSLKNFMENKIPFEDLTAVGETLAEISFKQGRNEEGYRILEELTKKGTQLGRGIQSFSYWSRLTPEGMLKYADQKIMQANEYIRNSRLGKIFYGGKVELSAQEKNLIREYMMKANQATDETAKQKYTRLAMKTISDKIPLTASKIFDAYRYNNMLSNPLTHLKNFFYNVWNTFITPAMTEAAQGKPLEAVKYEFNAIKNIPKGLDYFVKSVKGDIPIDLGKTEVALEELQYKKLPRAIRISSDLMEASDRLFNTIIKNAFIGIGKSEEEASKLAEYYLVRTPLKERGYGILSDTIRAMGEGIQAFGEKFKPIRWAIPFLRTPFDAAAMQVEYSPLGIVNLVGAKNKREVLAKFLLGSVATTIATKAALEGRTTWAPPIDPEEKKWFYATGRKPYSVYINGKWIPYFYFGPFALAIALPAAGKYFWEEAPDALSAGDFEKTAKTLSSVLYFWSQSTPMSGLGGFIRTIEGDIDFNISRNLAYTTGQIIPYEGLIRWVNNFFDNIYRRPKGFVEQMMTQLPFLSGKVKEYYQEPTGEPARRELINQFLPFPIGIPKGETPLYEQLYRERQEERQQNRLITELKKKIGEEELTPEQIQLLLTKTEKKEIEEGKTPLAAIVERKKLESLYSKGDQLFDLYLRTTNEDTKRKIEENIEKLGIDVNEGLYNYLSKQEGDVKREYILASIGDVKDRNKMIETLASFRKEGIASGKPILTTTIIDDLVDEGIITKEEGKYLKSVKWDAKQKKLTVRGEKKKIKLVHRKITIKKIPLLKSTQRPIKIVLKRKGITIPKVIVRPSAKKKISLKSMVAKLKKT